MGEPVDFVVQSDDNQVKLLVEAKTKADPSNEWVARIRKNAMEQTARADNTYFILALPDQFHIWSHAEQTATVKPDFSVSTREVLKSYIGGLESDLTDLSEQGFELVVRTWLEDLIRTASAANVSALQSWIVNSGLHERIKNAHITRNP